MEAAAPDLCAACRQPLAGPFCSACGERRVRDEDESLRHFLTEVFGVVTNADSKLWRSLRALFVPGKLTAEHFAGRRNLYLHPVRVFLILNVVFFFALSGAGGSIFRGPLSSHENASVYGPLASDLTDRQREEWGVEPPIYEAAFNQKADTLAPSLIGLLVPLLALLLAVVLWPARAAGVRHLVFATHAVAAVMGTMLVLLVVVSLLMVGLGALGYEGSLLRNVDPIVVPLTAVAVVTYFALGIRRVYGVPWWGAGISGLLLGTVGINVALVAFRFLLFWATWAMLDLPSVS